MSRFALVCSVLLVISLGCDPKQRSNPPESGERASGMAAETSGETTGSNEAGPDEGDSTHQTVDDEHSDLRQLSPEREFAGFIEMPFESRVVRDQSSYDELVEHLPEKKVVKKANPPPSDDPLLRQPQIDFDEYMLVVVTCPTYYCDIEWVGIRDDGDTDTIVVELPGEGENAEYHARPAGIGNYKAVVIPVVSGEVEFEFRGPGKRSEDYRGPDLE